MAFGGSVASVHYVYEMIIAHLTDIHVSGPQSFDFDIDLCANLDRTLRALPGVSPDLIVFTGDLFCTHSNIEYARSIFERMREICPSLLLVPGNHDQPSAIAEAAVGLTEAPPEWPQTVVVNGVRAVLLDTSGDRYGQENLEYVKKEARAAEDDNEPLLVFAHHPPTRMGGMPFLDLYFAPADADDAEHVFRSLDARWNLFCGHYHLEAQRRVGNGVVNITSAVAFTVHPRSETITVVGSDPCFRLIHVDPESRAVSSDHVVVRPEHA